MPSKKKSARTKRDLGKVNADAKRALTEGKTALKKIQTELNLELTKITRYKKAMDEHNSFNFD